MTLLNISPFAISRWGAFFNHFDLFFKGFLYTLGISFGALLLALILGILSGGLSTSKSKVGKLISRIYVEVFQNTPLLVQMVFVYYGLAIISNGHVMISAFFTAVLCVGLYHGAYISEVIRSGIEAVPKGQTEAALAQGFTYLQVFIIIIFPQAFRKMLPAIISQFVTVIKDTSLLYSVIAIQEIFGKSQILMGRYFEAGQVFTLYAIITAVYFITNFIISSFSRKLSKRWEQATE
ncbi:TPA: amino acid ABC transporter permease [Streptococcus agalactiae]|nr:amino acid ABC transporter permease [Streptococcus agalactiae]